jgi:CHAT domain-containing protein
MFAPQQIKLMTVAVESTRDVDMPRLHYAMSETRAVTSIVQRAGVIDSFAADTATKAEVLARLRSSQVVHFACHGVQHQHEPHKSHFCLGSDRVTVAELMNIDLNDAFLAFLSACETAKGDQKHVDEVIHLAASMLFAGFKSIVATMW